MVFGLWSSPNHIPIKYRAPIKKNNWITPAYLIQEQVTLFNSVELWWGFCKISETRSALFSFKVVKIWCLMVVFQCTVYREQRFCYWQEYMFCEEWAVNNLLAYEIWRDVIESNLKLCASTCSDCNPWLFGLSIFVICHRAVCNPPWWIARILESLTGCDLTFSSIWHLVLHDK